MMKLTFVFVVASATAVHAAPSRLTFEQAIGEGDRLPELTGRRHAADLIARAPTGHTWSPLVVAVMPSLRLAPGSGPEGGVSVQQAIPLADVARARRDHRDATAARARAEHAARLLDARLAAASAWIRCWAAGARLAAAERDAALARSIADVTARGTAAGAFTAPELADARAFLAEAHTRRLDAEGGVADAAFELAMTTGRTGQVLAEGDLPFPEVAPRATWPALVGRARRLPEVAAHALAARADRLRAVEDRRSRRPQLLLGGELLRDGPGALVATATVGISLPHDRGAREAALALADAQVAEAQAEAAERRGAVELDRALHDVDHTREVLDAIEQQLVPATDDAARRRRRARELGESTIVELLAAERAAVAAHARAGEARAAHAWALVRAWLLVQAVEGAS